MLRNCSLQHVLHPSCGIACKPRTIQTAFETKLLELQVGLIALNLTGVNIGWPQTQQSHESASQQGQEAQQPAAHSSAPHGIEHDSSRASPPEPAGMPLGIHQNGVPRPPQQQNRPQGGICDCDRVAIETPVYGWKCMEAPLLETATWKPID